RDRVGVEVQQRPAALQRRAEVAQVVEPEARADVAVLGRELGHAGPVRQAQAAAVGAAGELLDAAHRTAGEEGDEGLTLQRRAVRQAQDDRAVARLAPRAA